MVKEKCEVRLPIAFCTFRGFDEFSYMNPHATPLNGCSRRSTHHNRISISQHIHKNQSGVSRASFTPMTGLSKRQATTLLRFGAPLLLLLGLNLTLKSSVTLHVMQGSTCVTAPTNFTWPMHQLARQ